jgi:hypothetical protein
MALFLGVAVMQWFTGAVAGGAAAFGVWISAISSLRGDALS